MSDLTGTGLYRNVGDYPHPIIDPCAVGGCGGTGTNHREVTYTLGSHEVELEIPLCDYHLGWMDA